MAWDRCGPLLAQLARFGRLLELSCDVEEDCSRVARGLETCRQRCCRLGLDLRRAREQLLVAEAERSALQVRLEHARNQVRVEMKKRHRAEAELEKQERKLQLIYDFLMQDSLGHEQLSALALLDRQGLGPAQVPGGRLAAVDESCPSLMSHSDISYDHTEDNMDLEVTVVKPLEPKAGERPRLSLAPLIGPVVAAKHPRPSLPPAASASEPVVTPTAGAVAEELATVGGGSEDPESRAGLARGALDPSLPQAAPLPQHLFASKTVIRPESCSACGSRAHFGRVALRCRQCHVLVHPECRGRCPSPCTPGPRARPREGVLADFVPPTAPQVPAVVVKCVCEVESRGLAETGLYRVPGAEQLVREWKQKLVRARGAPPSLGRVADVHVVCGVLKDFLRGLQEPLVTFRLHPAFLQAADIPDEAASQAALCHMVNKLPPANRDTLAFLLLHLLRMDKLNLACVFGPTLVGHSSASPTPLAILEDTPRQRKVMARLLSLPPEFWRRFVGTELDNLVPKAAGNPLVLSARERLFCPVTSPKMSPASCCLPNPLRSCVGRASTALQVSTSRKMGRFFPSPK